MGISKIGSLFAANIDSLSARPQTQNKSQSESAPSSPSSSAGEAVVFSSTFGRSPLDTAAPSRDTKIQQLKEQVAKGEYRVDSEKVALAVYRDLA